jgi:hypothetical protein
MAGMKIPDDLVADELVDDGLVPHEDLCGRRVELFQQAAKCSRRHGLGEGCRAAHIGKEEGALDLGACAVLIEVPEAAPAIIRIARPTALPNEPQKRAERWPER